MKYLILLVPTLFFLSNQMIGQTDTTNRSINQITIKGIAHNRKGGAIVECNSTHYWIKEKDSWDKTYLNKKVTVKGILSTEIDYTIFLDTGELKKQGVPVYSEEQLEKNNKKNWINKAVISLSK